MLKKQVIRAAIVLVYSITVFVIPVTLTLHTVVAPATYSLPTDNPTPLGYTISLSLFIFPMLAISWWFFRHKKLSFQKPAFLLTVFILALSGFILDYLFGNAFFLFENQKAVLGIDIPAIGGNIPIEEFIFYGSGFMTVLLIYVWCDEYWLERYNIPDYHEKSGTIARLFRLHPGMLILGAIAIVLAILYKKVFSGEAGFPWYFIFLAAVAVTPASALYASAREFINWRALAFTFIIIVLVSLIWEVTLALPYQWWGYQHHAMMGVYIGAWHDLPLEAVVVWFSVSFTTTIVYESLKIFFASGKTWENAFLGGD